MEVRGAKNLREVDEAYELAARVFGPNYFGAEEAKAHVRALEPLRNLEDAVVAVNGEEVVGFVRILDRQYYSPVGVVQAGGITSVCVHPALRGRGWGLKVMEGAIRRSQHRGDAFSILFARRAVDGWYPRLGYVGIGCHVEMQVEAPPGIWGSSDFNGSIQTGIIDSYVNTYAEAYADSYMDMILSVCRDNEWWQNLEARLAQRVDAKDFVNVMLGGRPIGYFMLRDGKVIEAASLRQHRAALLAGLGQHCTSSHNERLVLALPSGHGCVEALRSMNHALSIRYSWDGGHMVRILDKDTFKKMVMQYTGNGTCESLETLFEQYDMSDHECARQLLLAIAGASQAVRCSQDVGNPAVPGAALLPMLPTWSIVDEL